MIELAVLVAGLAIGAAIAWPVAQSRLRPRVERAERDLAIAQTRVDVASQTQTQAIEALLERAKNELRDATAARAGEKVGDLVAPMSEKLSQFNKLINELEAGRQKDAGSLREQISSLLNRTEKLETATSSLTSQTSTLVTALRNPTTRGKWGEMQLRNVVEKAGMLPYCDFTEQQTITVDGGRFRPDMTINLPDDRRVFVDAKAPTDAMQAALDAVDDDARRALVTQHAKALQDHIDALARKNYQGAAGSADFVIMFVPGESFLSAACNEKPMLIEYALDKGVLVTGPLALISLLRSFSMGWQAVRQEENAKRIAAIGRELYERAQRFAEHLVRIRKGLEGSVEAFNGAVGSYETRLLPQGRKLKDEAALTADDLPDIGVIDTTARAITALDATPSSARRPRSQSLFPPDQTA
ncbi:MAG TPA: DNA recombination protein RmuC [Candidatus Baltobacteraceae bacterium]